MKEHLLPLLKDGLTTVPEATNFLRISRSTLYELMGKGELDYVKVGRTRRIPRNSLLLFVAGHLYGPSQNG